LQNRLLAAQLEKALGVTVVPINKPGGGGSLAAGVLANARPDGYTLALMPETAIMMPILLKQASFKLSDFCAIGQVNRGFPVVMVVPPDSPWKTFKEFVDRAKKHPSITCAHPPVTTTAFLKMSYLNKFAKLGMVGLPMRTDSEIFTAIMGKHVPVAVSGVGGGLQSLSDSGKIRILFSFHPPADAGLDPKIPDFQSFFGQEPFDFGLHLWAPAKTPPEIVKTLRAVLKKIVDSPGFKNDMKKVKFTAYYRDGDVLMKQVLPNSMEKLKEILTEIGMIK